MINAWSLLYDEIYGDDEMSPCSTDHINDDFLVGFSTASADTNVYTVDTSNFDTVSINTAETDEFITITGGDSSYDLSGVDFTIPPYEEPICTANLDDIIFAETPASTPSIKDPSNRKYNEDQSIEALKNYISTTYGGHYTSDNNNVQTLDLIESVGDAESFCRSNAIKYLSRYDKKGQAKRDILKALHYSLLLYHFSGQLNETTTRGYETF